MLARLLTVVALVLAGGCSAGTDPDTAAPAAPSAAAPAGRSAAASPEQEPVAAPRLIEVTYRGGEVTGVEPRVPVSLGESVVLRVSSDVAEQIHVHGYDLDADVPAGGTGEVAFIADLAGSWEVELHEAGRPMFQLRVS